MSDATEQALSKAYELIESDELSEASITIQSIIASEPDNIDAWWLYAHAVTDINQAHEALENVMRLDATYPGARALFEQSKIRVEVTTIDTVPATSSVIQPLDLDDSMIAADEDDQEEVSDDFESADEGNGLSRRWTALLLVFIVAIGVGSAILVLSANTDDEDVPEVQPTTAQVVERATDSIPANALNIDSLETALSGLTLAENPFVETSTELGNTLIVSICTTSGRGLRDSLPQALEAIAQDVVLDAINVSAFAARMLDCENDGILRVIGVLSTDAEEFAAGTISSADYQARWRSIG